MLTSKTSDSNRSLFDFQTNPVVFWASLCLVNFENMTARNVRAKAPASSCRCFLADLAEAIQSQSKRKIIWIQMKKSPQFASLAKCVEFLQLQNLAAQVSKNIKLIHLFRATVPSLKAQSQGPLCEYAQFVLQAPPFPGKGIKRRAW